MKALVSILVALILILAAPVLAGNPQKTPVASIIDHRASLGLTDSQVKKLQIIEDTAVQKMTDARVQADIRLSQIESFTSDWTNMNSLAVNSLVKEYFDFLSQVKAAELHAIIQARAVLKYEQLTRFQQLVSIESLILHMESELALR